MNPFDAVLFLWLFDGEIVVREDCARWQAWVYFCVLFLTEAIDINLHRASCRVLRK